MIDSKNQTCRKVTVSDLIDSPSPEIFITRTQEHLKWLRQITQDKILEIKELAKKKFRGWPGHSRVKRFLGNLIKQFEDGVRSVNELLNTATKHVLTKTPNKKIRRNRSLVKMNPRTQF